MHPVFLCQGTAPCKRLGRQPRRLQMIQVVLDIPMSLERGGEEKNKARGAGQPNHRSWMSHATKSPSTTAAGAFKADLFGTARCSSKEIFSTWAWKWAMFIGFSLGEVWKWNGYDTWCANFKSFQLKDGSYFAATVLQMFSQWIENTVISDLRTIMTYSDPFKHESASKWLPLPLSDPIKDLYNYLKGCVQLNFS